jgi:hypothetical protein
MRFQEAWTRHSQVANGQMLARIYGTLSTPTQACPSTFGQLWEARQGLHSYIRFITRTSLTELLACGWPDLGRGRPLSDEERAAYAERRRCEELKLARAALRHLNKVINPTLRDRERPRRLHDFLGSHRSWHLMHGAHPPRLSALVALVTNLLVIKNLLGAAPA